MRTLAAGLHCFRRSPWALLPITAEGVVLALLIAFGVIPHSGASAAASAAFPLDVFFDVKQLLAQSTSWPRLLVALFLVVTLRSAVLAATVTLADRSKGDAMRTARRAGALVIVAVFALAPAAVLMFAGMASRYAPFVWAGAAAGLVPALLLARRAVRLDGSVDASERSGIPEAPAYLGYAYFIALFGAAMSSFGEVSRFVSAGVVLFATPLNALVFLGWREHARKKTYTGGGTIAWVVTIIVLSVLLLGAVYDRYVRTLPPVSETPAQGTLLLLGGVDSTLETGALNDADVRNFGFPENRTEAVSYRGPDQAMNKSDTRIDPARVATELSEYIDAAEPPVSVLGHSQASLILDRLFDRGLPAPARAAVLAPPPPFPPPVEIPTPDTVGTGKPGGDLARIFAAVLRSVGFESYDVDTAAFPTNLEAVVLIDNRVPRLAVWALGDSVWLDQDWRRPGETNLVALTDHVGIVNNDRTVGPTRAFFTGEMPVDDETSWRGAFVSLLRHAFGPWRPEL